MLTLNQIKAKLIEYFQGHGQVNDVVYADDFEFNAERHLVYPAVNIEFLNAAINDRFLNYNFKVVIGSLVDVNVPGMADDIHSDTIQIAEDFFAFLGVEEGWVFQKSSSLQPFREDTGDLVAGVVFTITLSVVRAQNECVKPTKNNPTP